MPSLVVVVVVGHRRGMGAKLTQTVLNAALLFVFYETLQPIILARVLQQQLAR